METLLTLAIVTPVILFFLIRYLKARARQATSGPGARNATPVSHAAVKGVPQRQAR